MGIIKYISEQNMKKVLLVLVPFSLGYLITSIFRSINAIQGVYLQKDLSLTIFHISVISSIYFLAFCLGQIPLGIFLDKYGSRVVQGFLFLIAAIGTMIFAFADNYSALLVGRFIIGIGVCGGLMCAFKANVEYFPKKIPIMNSIVLFVGGLGVVVAGKPSELLISYYGWRNYNILISIVLIMLSLFFYIFTPSNKEAFKNNTSSKSFFETICFLNKKQIWIILLLTVIPSSMFTSMQTYWITPWFKYVRNISSSDIAILISLLGIVMTLGLLMSGIIGNYFQNKYGSANKALFFTYIVSLISQIIILVNIKFFSIMAWFIYFFIVQTAMFGYSQISIIAGKEISGKAITIFTIVLFALSFSLQYIFGVILKLLATYTLITNISFRYQISLGIYILIQIIILFYVIILTINNEKY